MNESSLHVYNQDNIENIITIHLQTYKTSESITNAGIHNDTIYITTNQGNLLEYNIDGTPKNNQD